jgi:hypothetical protein
MKTTTKLIISAALLTILAAPASARNEGDEGGDSAYAYPRFRKERSQTYEFRRPSDDLLINRPFPRRYR